MDANDVTAGRARGRVALRVGSTGPYSSELTAGQIGAIADIAERYGSGAVHVTPRQTMEIPHIDIAALPDVTTLLAGHGLHIGYAGRRPRNVTACSHWCLYNVAPMRDAALQLNCLLNENENEKMPLPGKTNISLSGCGFSCVRSRTSDVGVIARSEIVITDKKCKKCSLCVKEPLGCQVDAITLAEGAVVIDRQKCVRCGFCSGVCRPGSIMMKSKSFDVFIGGNGGLKPREAFLYRTVPSLREAMELIGSLLEGYRAHAREGERIGDLIERAGMEWPGQKT
ncbi:MAG: hypothetical protein M0Z58_09600 [Nitrospiraceae bacterium]|nr:hypothetical protein [Nitrospiraceae bacterium]